MPEKIPRFDAFIDAHFGLGIRWRRSMFFHGYDISVALPGACIIVSVGKRVVREVIERAAPEVEA